jgi:hypothetical protein
MINKLQVWLKLAAGARSRYQHQFKIDWSQSSSASAYDYLFDSANNYLRLDVAPEDYQVINNYEGEGTRLVAGFSRTIPTVSLLRRTIRIRVADDRALIRWLVEDTARISNSTVYSGTFTPIELIDYVRPEYVDVAATPQGQTPYTVRYGMIPLGSIESGGTWAWRNDYRHQGGFSFEFIEAVQRVG